MGGLFCIIFVHRFKLLVYVLDGAVHRLKLLRQCFWHIDRPLSNLAVARAVLSLQFGANPAPALQTTRGTVKFRLGKLLDQRTVKQVSTVTEQIGLYCAASLFVGLDGDVFDDGVRVFVGLGSDRLANAPISCVLSE